MDNKEDARLKRVHPANKDHASPSKLGKHSTLNRPNKPKFLNPHVQHIRTTNKIIESTSRRRKSSQMDQVSDEE